MTCSIGLCLSSDLNWLLTAMKNSSPHSGNCLWSPFPHPGNQGVPQWDRKRSERPELAAYTHMRSDIKPCIQGLWFPLGRRLRTGLGEGVMGASALSWMFSLLKCIFLFFKFWPCWVFIVAHGLSLAVVRGLRSCSPWGSLVVAPGLNCPVVYRILVPRPGIEPPSLALEGRFPTTGLPGKSLFKCIWIQFACPVIPLTPVLQFMETLVHGPPLFLSNSSFSFRHSSTLDASLPPSPESTSIRKPMWPVCIRAAVHIHRLLSGVLFFTIVSECYHAIHVLLKLIFVCVRFACVDKWKSSSPSLLCGILFK